MRSHGCRHLCATRVVSSMHLLQMRLMARARTTIPGRWNSSAKVVLLVGPAFLDHTVWSGLLGGVAVKPNFNLRVTGIDPQSVDLNGVAEAADFYTCDLAAGDLTSVTAQIGRVVARIAE